MTGRVVAAIAAVLVAAQSQRGQPPPRPPTFRATTAVVSVDVSVRRGNVPVAQLTAADFDLEDNGVTQRIESVTVEAVPIDVSLAVDVSGSVESDFGAFRNDVRRFAAMLRPIDRIRVVSFGTGVQEIVPMQPASAPLNLDALTSGGASSSNDGLFYALLWPTDVDRRHLVIAMTDGIDNMSTLNSASVVDVAARARAVFHVVLVEGLQPPQTTWEKGSRDAVIEAAKQSGGSVHAQRGALSTFKRIFDDFRASYVLRYTPEGVERAGWHDLAVKVRAPDAGKLTIRAKRGYWGG